MNYNHNGTKNLWRWVHQNLGDSLLTEAWLEQLSHYTTLIVGYSGGLDSSVLLHCLANNKALSIQLKAVHINHGLSVHAQQWQHHCEQVCKRYSIDFVAYPVNLTGMANVEERAREARYGVFSGLMSDNSALLLAHHADDQAETLLLQLLRGAGIDGLAAMADVKPFSKGSLLRPLLQCSRQDLEAYAHQNQLVWVEDESNENHAFSRNYLRHEIIPRLKTKWPSVIQHLARSALHCQQAKQNLDALACVDVADLERMSNQLPLTGLHDLSLSRMANVLRSWLKNNQVRCPSVKMLHRLIHEIILSKPDANPMIHWDDVVIRRYQQTLYLLKNEEQHYPITQEWISFPNPLPWGNSGLYLQTKLSEEGLMIPPGSRIYVRCRQGGETLFWHGKTKQLKKLFQAWSIPPWRRDEIPLLYVGEDLAAVVGYAINDHYYQKKTADKNSFSITLESM